MATQSKSPSNGLTTTELPSEVTESGLWKKVGSDRELAQALKDIRHTAEAIAETIREQIPDFTDHSVTHMDALWGVGDEVFTEKEIDQFTVGEAFVLGASFYVHDLGMAAASTEEGRQELQKSREYHSNLERLLADGKFPRLQAELVALRMAARETHAKRALKIVHEKLPIPDEYLIPRSSLREAWGEHIGQISASHAWPLAQVKATIGGRDRVPVAKGGNIDLGFLACALRVIDYAHMNASRAEPLYRALRGRLPEESLWHWYAQERIAGPDRQGDLLVYGTTKGITDVDAWWIFFEMATGLDREIIDVREYLDGRACSTKRFSLEGVKSVRTPKAFATLVAPSGFAPVDVRFRPDSVNRLVGIFGGSNLYGDDEFAAVRELLQNARDAIHLKRAVTISEEETSVPGEIRVDFVTENEKSTLIVADNGFGMDEKVVTTYLLGIAADYWHSNDYYADVPITAQRNFCPVGKFGIGFLSIFMLGDDVEVQTARHGNPRVTLKLRGVGRRGTLTRGETGLRSGTSVAIRIRPEQVADFENLESIVRSRAPMLDVPISIVRGASRSRIEAGWWQSVSQQELLEFVGNRDTIATVPARKRTRPDIPPRLRYGQQFPGSLTLSLADLEELSKWPGIQPEAKSNLFRVIATPGYGAVVLCSNGFGIRTVRFEGMAGVVDIGDVKLDAARSAPIDFNASVVQKQLTEALFPIIIKATDQLDKEGNIPGRYKFLSGLGSAYGTDLLTSLALPWITIIEPLGNTKLISASALADLVMRRDEIFVTFATGPWYAVQNVKELHPTARADDLIIAVSSAGQRQPGSFRDESGTIFNASLEEHFRSEYSRGTELGQQHLLLSVLSIIADAWSTQEELLYLNGWIRRDRILVGRLHRPTLNE